MRWLAPFVAVLASTFAPRVVHASEPREPSEECTDRAARFEISPWLAVGGGMRWIDAGRRSVIGVLAADTAVTIPLVSTTRIGVWTAPGTTDFASFDLPAGARIEVHSHELNQSHSDLFGVGGRYTAMLDAGVGTRIGADGNRGPFWVARVAFGFTAPNRLYHLYGEQPACHCERHQDQQGQWSTSDECRPELGQASGVRPFVSVQRAFDGSFTELGFGLSFETIGAGWWLGSGI